MPFRLGERKERSVRHLAIELSERNLRDRRERKEQQRLSGATPSNPYSSGLTVRIGLRFRPYGYIISHSPAGVGPVHPLLQSIWAFPAIHAWIPFAQPGFFASICNAMLLLTANRLQSLTVPRGTCDNIASSQRSQQPSSSQRTDEILRLCSDRALKWRIGICLHKPRGPTCALNLARSPPASHGQLNELLAVMNATRRK